MSSFDTNLGLDTTHATPEEAREMRRDFVLAHPTAGVRIAWITEGMEGIDGDWTDTGELIATRPRAHPGVPGVDLRAAIADWAAEYNVPLGAALTATTESDKWKGVAADYALAQSLGDTSALDAIIAAMQAVPAPVDEVEGGHEGDGV